MNIIGDIAGKDCLLIDDIVDSGGTLCNAADAMLAKGASSVTAYITRRSLRRRGHPRHLLEAARTRHHGFDPADHGRAFGPQYPRRNDGAADRRSHQPNGPGRVRLQSV